ncbi:MAG TPA: CRISPR-associated endonuclease Cas2 [Candidatus Binataceae bacterium]|nr:CRISPR-associated endonuclease Cas2 [Candidatus Binataceae bacterium]HVB80029.1 CRISPR-associated endonuclease Cas2 [Candidatus Binataceae bacterium]
MEILVAYDVATDNAEGKRRLRRVAEVCLAFGQRVQKSVFECILSEADLEILKHRLSREIEGGKDSIRIYRLMEPREKYLSLIGKQPKFDLHDPLLV